MTLAQVETGMPLEHNQADNLLHLQVLPHRQTPALLQYSLVFPGLGDIFINPPMTRFTQDLPDITRTSC